MLDRQAQMHITSSDGRTKARLSICAHRRTGPIYEQLDSSAKCLRVATEVFEPSLIQELVSHDCNKEVHHGGHKLGRAEVECQRLARPVQFTSDACIQAPWGRCREQSSEIDDDFFGETLSV